MFALEIFLTMVSRSSSGRQSSPLVLVVTAVCLMLFNLMFLVFVSRIDSRMATLERDKSDVRSSSLANDQEAIARRDLSDVGEVRERNKRAIQTSLEELSRKLEWLEQR